MNPAKGNPDYIVVRVYAGVRQERLTQTAPHHFEVWVREEAKQNAANRRISALIAAEYGVTPARVRIVSGHHTPKKILTITNQS